MDDPLKPQVNYSEVLAHIKDRQNALEGREKDLAARHERLLKLEKAVGDNQETLQAEIAQLERTKMNLKSDVAKGHLAVEKEVQRLSEEQAQGYTRIAELKSQIVSLETSYNMNFGRNQDLAKSIQGKEQQLGAKNRELTELINYHKEQEKSVQEALDAYNEQLHASGQRLEELNQQIASETDQLESLREDLRLVTEFGETERSKIGGEIVSLEEQRDSIQSELTDKSAELNQVLKKLEKTQQTHDKTLIETEELIKKGLQERKAATESLALLKKVEADASDERRRLQSDRAIYGQL